MVAGDLLKNSFYEQRLQANVGRMLERRVAQNESLSDPSTPLT